MLATATRHSCCFSLNKINIGFREQCNHIPFTKELGSVVNKRQQLDLNRITLESYIDVSQIAVFYQTCQFFFWFVFSRSDGTDPRSFTQQLE